MLIGAHFRVSQIKFKTAMLMSSLCDYSDAYILVEGAITITRPRANAVARQADKGDKGVAFENWVSFITCTIEVNDTLLYYIIMIKILI